MLLHVLPMQAQRMCAHRSSKVSIPTHLLQSTMLFLKGFMLHLEPKQESKYECSQNLQRAFPRTFCRAPCSSRASCCPCKPKKCVLTEAAKCVHQHTFCKAPCSSSRASCSILSCPCKLSSLNSSDCRHSQGKGIVSKVRNFCPHS